MKKIFFGIITLMIILLPINAFAQPKSQAQAKWIAFQLQMRAKRTAFMEQMKQEKNAFLQANPDVKEYLSEMYASAKKQTQQWRSVHSKTSGPDFTPIR